MSSSLNNIKKSTLSIQAYEEIRKAITLNRLHPGEPLIEENLSQELGISRTPVRTALQQLVNDGYAQVTTGKNICVTQLTRKETHDIALVRCTLETLAVSLLKDKLTPDLITALERNNNQQLAVIDTQQPDFTAFIDLDFYFHTTLAAATDNQFLCDTIKKANVCSTNFLSLSSTLEKSSRLAIEEHKSIIAFLKTGQLDYAIIAMRDHINNVDSRILSE